jgi:hypothetical protein
MPAPRWSPTARWWKPTPAIRWTSSTPTTGASRWRCARPAALLRRAGGLLRLRRRALHREEAGAVLPARHAGHARHPAAALRGGGRHRQPVGQAVPHRLRRPGAARGLLARQARLAPARAAALLGQRAAAQAHAQLPGRAPFAKADYLAAVERAKG